MDNVCSIDALYKKYYRELVAWANYMTNNKYIAEDLVQEAFLKALNYEEVFERIHELQARAWIYQTVRHLFIDRTRHLKNENLMDSVPESECESDDLSEIEWLELLLELEPEMSRMVVMRYVEGYTSTEISKIFGIPPGTVRSKLSMTMKTLRKKVEESYE